MAIKKQTKQSNTVVLVLLLIFTIINFSVIMNMPKEYQNAGLGVTLGVVVLLFSLLTNALYLNGRMQISPWHITTSFFSFLLIINYLIVLGMLFVERTTGAILFDYLMGLGRFWFVIGNIPWIYMSKFSFSVRGYPKMILSALVLLTVQILFHLLITLSHVDQDNLIFLMNAVTGSILLIFVLGKVVGDLKNETPGGLMGFAMMLVGQIYLTLSTGIVPNLIQGHLFWIAGAGYYFYGINQSNILIPVKENKLMQNQFNLYAKNLKKIIDKKTLQVRDINKRLIDDLEYAKIIQQSLLPDKKTTFRDVTLFSEFFPCERLSGDFFDLYRLDDDHIALYLLDVSGHGISAALLTMFSSNYLKSNDQNLMRYRGFKPERNLKHFYEQFNLMSFPDEMHMVLFYATLNLTTKVLTYCSGGMNCAPIRFSKSGRVDFLDDSKGFPICKLNDFFTPEYKSEQIPLEKGDRILFYTDGLIDMEKNGVFDLDSLMDFYKNHAHLSVNELNHQIAQKIEPKKNNLNDDITYILMEV